MMCPNKGPFIPKSWPDAEKVYIACYFCVIVSVQNNIVKQLLFTLKGYFI